MQGYARTRVNERERRRTFSFATERHFKSECVPIRQTARKRVWHVRRVIHRLTCVLVKLADRLMIQQVLRAGTSARSALSGGRAFLFAAERTGGPSPADTQRKPPRESGGPSEQLRPVVNSRGLCREPEAKDRGDCPRKKERSRILTVSRRRRP